MNIPYAALKMSKDRTMKNTVKSFIAISLSTVVGCSSGQIARSTDAVQRSIPKAYVTASLYRLDPVLVPMPVQGATLRSVAADARDLASQGGAIINAYVLNDAKMISNLTGLAIEKKDLDNAGLVQSWAGGEIFVLIRGGTRIFIPAFMVHDTAAGNCRVLPNDTLLSMPSKNLKYWSNRDQGGTEKDPDKRYAKIEESRKSNNGTFTLTGDYFAELTLPVNGSIVKFVAMEKAFTGSWFWGTAPKPPVLDNNQPAPNAVVVSRLATDGLAEVFILPFVAEKENSAEFSANIVSGNVHDTLGILNGDTIAITRLERIPLIAAGLATPITPRLPETVVVQDAPSTLQNLGRKLRNISFQRNR